MNLLRSIVFVAALFLSGAQTHAQNPGTVTNHAYAIGKGPGVAGYTSLLCASGQLAIGQSGANPACFVISGDATLSAAGVLTLQNVNSNVGAFGSATQCTVVTVNAKGLVTAISSVTCTPAIANVTGLGTGAATALAVNVGTAGSIVVNGGALGTPSSGVGTNLTGIPTAALTGVLQAAQEPAHTGDATNTAGSLALTFATVNANVGSFGSATQCPTFTTNAKGLITAASQTACTPALTAGNFANPSALAGPTAVNGTATTAMRSDAAPAVNQAVAYGWTGQHSWVNGGPLNPESIQSDSADATPSAINNQALVLRNYNTTANNYVPLEFHSKDTGGTERTGAGVMGVFSSRTASMVQTDLIFFNRTIDAVIHFPLYMQGNTVAFGSSASSGVPALVPSGTTLQARLGDNSADAPFSASNLSISGTLIAKGTVPVGTTGSCVASSFVGGATAGKFSAAVCAGGTIILSSLPAAPNGYTCNAQDQTTPADTLKQTANTATSVTFTATTAAADAVAFDCRAW